MAVQDGTKQKRSKRRLGLVLSTLALAGAGGLSWLAGTTTADYFEDRLTRDARAGLAAQSLDWVQLRGDGTLIHLSGTSPDEIARFRALQAVQDAIEPGRAIDGMQVAAPAEVAAPDFGIELLYNAEGVSVIGLVPATTDLSAILALLQTGAGDGGVFEALETADYAVPAGWDEALAFGLEAGRLTKSAKISIAAGHVTVEAITDSEGQRAALEQALQKARPDGVELSTDITAPRPLISPFLLRLVLDKDGARLEACTADTDEARARILAAASRAGVAAGSACQLGLGAPSRSWGEVAERAIDTLSRIGAGSATLSDHEIGLRVPVDVGQAAFDEAVSRLQAGLPSGYTLKAQQDQPADEGPEELTASIGSSGQVVLRGRITDIRMRDAIESFARSRFGQADSDLRIDPDLPGGWAVRVIAALEAMSQLHDGTARVTPDVIRIGGISGDQNAADLVARHLADRLGAGARYELAIRYDRWLDPVLSLPSGAECVDGLNTIMTESEIGFEPGRSVIAGDPGPTLALIADVMANCSDFRIEIGGHTDSQGSEGLNAELSRKRAQAVLEAMGETGMETRHMTARGYGESQPVADNETQAGREANRRIEFRLLTPQPVTTGPLPQMRTVTGVTEAAPQAMPPALPGPDLPKIIPIPGTGPDLQEPVPDEQGGFEVDPVPYATMMATILVNELMMFGSEHDHLDDESELGAEPPGDMGASAPVDAATALVHALISGDDVLTPDEALTRAAADIAAQEIGGFPEPDGTPAPSPQSEAAP